MNGPNPIGGDVVAGPVLDAGKEAFVGFHTIPVRHGMTVGELARLFAAERKLSLDLHVVRMEGWRRADRFDATGLQWIDPSPNMLSLTAALLYPDVGLLETTNLTVAVTLWRLYPDTWDVSAYNRLHSEPRTESAE